MNARRVRADRAGELWLLDTNAGLLRKAAGPSTDIEPFPAPFPPSDVHDFTVTPDHVLLATPAGVVTLNRRGDPRPVSIVLESLSIDTISASGRWASAGGELFDIDAGRSFSMPSPAIGLYPLKGTDLLVAHSRGGASVLSGGDLKPLPLLGDRPILDFAEAADRYWYATADGLFLGDSLTSPPSLHLESPSRTVFVDSSGVWTATRDGLAHTPVAPRVLTPYRPDLGLTEITSILPLAKHTLFGTFDGLLEASPAFGPTNSYLPGQTITALADTPRGVFAGTFEAGLALIANGEQRDSFSVADTPQHNAVTALLFQPPNLFVATYSRGLWFMPLDLEPLRLHSLAPELSKIHALARDPATGDIWLGADQQLYSLKGGTPGMPQYRAATTARIRTLLAADSQLWVGTHDGLSRCALSTPGPLACVQELSPSNSPMTGSRVVSLFRTPRALWFSTTAALHRFDLSTRSLFVFGSEHGHPAQGGWHPASVGSLATGEHILGGPSGAFRVRPALFPTEIGPSRGVTLTSVFVNGQPALHVPGEALQLAYGAHLQVHFAQLDFADVAPQYSFRLDEDDWTPNSPLSVATFGRLSPGPHALRIRANGPQPGLTPLLLEFSIATHPLRTPVAYGTYGLALLLLVLFLFRRRLETRTSAALAARADALSSLSDISRQLRVAKHLDFATDLPSTAYLLETLRHQLAETSRTESAQVDPPFTFLALTLVRPAELLALHGQAAVGDLLLQLRLRLEASPDLPAPLYLARGDGPSVLLSCRQEPKLLSDSVLRALRRAPLTRYLEAQAPPFKLGWAAFPWLPAHPSLCSAEAVTAFAAAAAASASTPGEVVGYSPGSALERGVVRPDAATLTRLILTHPGRASREGLLTIAREPRASQAGQLVRFPQSEA